MSRRDIPTATSSRLQGFTVQRLAAFSADDTGGNPAGIVLCQSLPDATVMQAIAAEVGYSETAFAAPGEHGWRVRYFAPEIEVPFCGHATVALGAALAMEYGGGAFALQLNQAHISVEGHRDGNRYTAALQSPPTHSEPAAIELVTSVLALFGYAREDLDPRLPPALADAGARHVILPLATRQRLTEMHYPLEAGRRLMLAHGLATIALVFAERPGLFHARNPFAAGGVYEDPATGAAAAALAGYLRDLDWPHDGVIDIHQGDDMGIPSRLRAEIGVTSGSSIRVSGSVRCIAE
ncbi:PhzF family phenazine biosynthesis protein [Frateuria aurantia]